MAMDLAAIKMVFSHEFWIMSIYWPLSLLYAYFQLLLFSSSSPSYPCCSFSFDSSSKIKKPICIITGATSGLGLAAARALAKEGYYVILVDHNSENLCQTIQDIKHKNEDACLKSFLVDLASVQSVMNFEEMLKQWLLDYDLHPSIQLLINNAGILATNSRVTSDGYDQMVEINYVGAFLLTNILLPLLKNSPIPSRIVNVSSFTHYSVSNAKVDKKNLCCLATSRNYPLAHIYQYSKFCLLLFSYELHRRLNLSSSSATVSVNAADPGAVETKLMRELPKGLSEFAFTILRWLRLLKSPEDGVASIIDAALAPPKVSGKYFFGGKGRTIRSSSISYNAKLAENLWSSTNELLQESLAKRGGDGGRLRDHARYLGSDSQTFCQCSDGGRRADNQGDRTFPRFPRFASPRRRSASKIGQKQPVLEGQLQHSGRGVGHPSCP